jgi:hypothetical protein
MTVNCNSQTVQKTQIRENPFGFTTTIVLCFMITVFDAGKLKSQSSKDFWEQRLTPQDETVRNSIPIRVYIDIEKSKRLFLLDTGSGGYTFDLALKSVGLPILRNDQVITPNGTITVPVHVGTAIGIGNTQLALGEVGFMDLTALSRAFGDKVEGILGVPLAIEYGIGYDNAGSFFYLGRASVRAFDQTFPLDTTAGAVYSKIELETESLNCLIDTGMNTPISISARHFDALRSRNKLTQLHDIRVQTLNGERFARFGIIDIVEVWGIQFADVPVIESTDCKIGLELLKRFDFFINGPSETIELSTHDQTNAHFRWDQSGIGIICVDGRVTIDSVRPHSPAECSGLTVGASIVEVNEEGIEANWQELFRLRDLFSAPSPMTIRLLVEQNGLRQSIELAW